MHPGFLALASLVLALGIGLNAAIFSIVYALLFRPLPVHAPDELVSVYMVTPRQPDRPWVIWDGAAEFLRSYNDDLADVAMHWSITRTLRIEGDSHRINLEWVTTNYFQVVGVRPALGRTLLPAEDHVSTAERAIVISDALWRRQFKTDPQIIGRQVALTSWDEPDLTFTVVGVMPPGFTGISEPWKPTQAWISFAQARFHRPERLVDTGVGIARLAPGITVQQARASVAAQSRAAAGAMFGRDNEPRLVVYPTRDVRIPNDPSAAVIPVRLAGAMTIVVAMVLLVAATNIAGILMARGVGRSGEIAVRRVLGAAPIRIVRQLLAESLLLSLAGGVLGLLLAGWLLDLFRAITPTQYAFDVTMNSRVLLFTTAVCLTAGLIVGALPARQTLALDILPWLSVSSAGQTRRTRRGLRHAITLPQVTVSLVLLLIAGVYIRALLTIELADVGYQPRNLLVAYPALRVQPGERRTDPRATPDPQGEERFAERRRRFYRELFARLQSLSGTESVAIADALPLREPPERPNWSVVSQEAYLAGDRKGPGTERASISPGYFETMRIPLLSGRVFDDRDARTSPRVAIVSASLAERLWPGREAVGRSLAILNEWGTNEKIDWFEVVGVVGDVRPVLQERAARPLVYFSLGQEWRPWSGYALVRGSGDSRTLVPSVQNAVLASDSFADVIRIQTMTQAVAEMLYLRRLAAVILAVSGAIALLLATIGIYGVVSYSVAQRTGEIGVRIALGAERRDIVRLVLREGAAIAALGSIAGLATGYLTVRITSARYLALPQLDLATMVLAPLVIGAVVILACYLPARRAGAVEAMEVLRRV